MELSKNLRAGHDLWWSNVLEECRVGCLSEHNFCYLHGFPTTPIRRAPIKSWYEYRDQTGSPCTCPTDTRDSSKAWLRPVDVSKACLDEKHRRCRWHQQRHALILDTSAFEDAMFLTPYRNAVIIQICSVLHKRQVQIIWMRCVDTVPSHFAGFYRSEEALHNEQNKWRHLNARKRKGIL